MQIIGAVGGTYSGVAPTMGAATGAAGGWTATITNYDAAYSYTATTTAGSVAAITSSTITQSGLGNNVSSTVTITTTRSGYESASGTVSGTSFSQLATPTLGSATSAVGAFSLTITNYDAANGYTVTSTAGTPSRSGSTITVSGLGNGASATVSVTATRAGFVNSATATQSGSSLNQVATPTFGSYTINYPGGRYKYKVSIANYDAANTYTVSVSAGSFTRTNELITVTGSADSQSITVYVTASRAGYANSTQAAYGNNTSGAPCAGGTYLYGPVYYTSIGGVPNACGYNGVCDGNYGIGLQFVSGPCGYPGDYCPGC